jgi:hypothetical protein
MQFRYDPTYRPLNTPKAPVEPVELAPRQHNTITIGMILPWLAIPAACIAAGFIGGGACAIGATAIAAFYFLSL